MRWSASVGLVLVAAAGCGVAPNGSGRVDARLKVDECRPSGDFTGGYRYEADRLDTQRFEDTLTILVLDYSVDIEQGDGLFIRIDDVKTIGDPMTEPRPFSRSIDRSANGVNASLSLFQTCPDRPTLRASSGRVTFSSFSIATDPADTGDQELLVGTLTATLTGVDGNVAGSLTAEFDFRPRRLPVKPQ